MLPHYNEWLELKLCLQEHFRLRPLCWAGQEAWLLGSTTAGKTLLPRVHTPKNNPKLLSVPLSAKHGCAGAHDALPAPGAAAPMRRHHRPGSQGPHLRVRRDRGAHLSTSHSTAAPDR